MKTLDMKVCPRCLLGHDTVKFPCDYIPIEDVRRSWDASPALLTTVMMMTHRNWFRA